MGSHSHGDEFNIRMNVVGFREMVVSLTQSQDPQLFLPFICWMTVVKSFNLPSAQSQFTKYYNYSTSQSMIVRAK